MSDRADHVTISDDKKVRFSPSLVERAQRMVGARDKKATGMELPLFGVIAGLMAGSVVKRKRPR